MAYVSVPKDLSKIKSKVLFSLTQRQLICFSAGAVIGVPLFFLLRNRIGVSSAALVMMFVMVPAFLLAMPSIAGFGKKCASCSWSRQTWIGFWALKKMVPLKKRHHLSCISVVNKQG